MVLLLLAIAAAAMAGVCRASMEKSLRASRAQADLQRRWGVVTFQTVLLPRAERVLSREPTPVAEVRRDVSLGGQAFTLVFGDEQAKANVNTLFRAGGLAGTERAVRQAAGAADGVRIDLRPLPRTRPPATDDDDPPPVFETLGQVFGRTPPAALVAPRGASPAAASVVTCWGDGTLNFRRASDDAVRTVCARHMASAEVSRLLAMRAKKPDADASDLLDRLKLTEAGREALDELLTDDSACHSLWVVQSPARPKRV